MTLPLVAMHKVEKQMNKVCFSKEKVKTCGGLMAGKGLGPGSMKQKLVKYACVSAPSAKAESLKKRAMGGEALDFELNELPISYTKMEKEPLYCGVEGGKLMAYHSCDTTTGYHGNPDCGSGEICVAKIVCPFCKTLGICEPANKYRSEGGAGGLGGGYGSEFGSGIEGGFTDEPSCWTAPMSMCNDPNFARKCGQKCYGGPDNEMLNLRDQQLTSNPKFIVEDKGSSLCGGGYAIMGANKCKEACKALNLPQMQIHGSNLCYKDNEGKCYQDGQEKWARNRYGVSLICEKVGLGGGAEGLEGGYGAEFGSGVQGVESGAGSKCDTRKGYDGNPACENGETCVPTIMNLGECRTVAVGAPGAKKCSTRQGELNNPKCFSTQKCIWSFHYQSGVCVFKSTQFQAAESEIKVGATNSYQQEGESCGMGVVKNHGQCRPDLECVFAPMELIGTCQVKKHKGDCTTFNDEGFDETHGAICKGNTDKVLNDFFDADFQEESLSNCKKFCNCIKECKGFNFNPNSNKRKCSWKTDSPIETFTNAGIERSGQSCVIKGLQLENGEESLVGGYGSGAQNGGYGMGGGYESGSGRDAYGSGLEGGSIGGSYGMGGGYRSEGGNGGNGMEGGYGSGVMGGDFGYGAGKGAHGMGGYGGARQGMGGGYGGGSENGAGGLRGGYGSEFGNGAQDYRLNPYKGKKYCDQGDMVATAEECKRACKYLGLPIKEILPRWFCYKDSRGDCYANGRSGPGAQVICVGYGVEDRL